METRPSQNVPSSQEDPNKELKREDELHDLSEIPKQTLKEINEGKEPKDRGFIEKPSTNPQSNADFKGKQ